MGGKWDVKEGSESDLVLGWERLFVLQFKIFLQYFDLQVSAVALCCHHAGWKLKKHHKLCFPPPKVSLPWDFAASCHSWHLTHRLRKSEKVTAQFHQVAYSRHLSQVRGDVLRHPPALSLLIQLLLLGFSDVFLHKTLFFTRPSNLSCCIASRLTVKATRQLSESAQPRASRQGDLPRFHN